MITVLVASYNGADTLPMTLSAMNRLEGGDDWKLVIVDNGSTDDTRAVIQAHASELPLHYVFEPRRGKNNALNAGLSFAEGDIVVFTDDDVIPDPDWLTRYREAVERQPEYDVFGGAILPHWMAEPPEWVIRRVPLGPVFGLTAPDRTEGPTGAGSVWGANMAIRRRVFDAGYRFDGSVGPDGTHSYAQGSETSFCRLLERDGYKAWFIPDAQVRHIIAASQIDRHWILGRAYRFGRGQYRLGHGQRAAGAAHLAGYPRWMVRKFAVSTAKYWALRALGRAPFESAWDYHYLRGCLAEARMRDYPALSTRGSPQASN